MEKLETKWRDGTGWDWGMDIVQYHKIPPKKSRYESKAFLGHSVIHTCCVGMRRRVSSHAPYTGWVSHPYVCNYLWGATAVPFGTKGTIHGHGQTVNDPLLRAERRHWEAQDRAVLAGNGVKAHWASPYRRHQPSHSLPRPAASGRGGYAQSSNFRAKH